MKHKSQQAFSLILLIMIATSGNVYTDFSQVCNQISGRSTSNFKELPKQYKIDYDTIQSFKTGSELGHGTFGIVKKNIYKSIDGQEHPVAIKEISYSKIPVQLILNEISASEAVSNSEYLPRLWGCTQGSDSKIYMVQELLKFDLASVSFRDYIRSETIENSLKLYIQMFEGVRDLWIAGYVHNDIKPANMMTNNEMSRIYLIDLGMAQQNTGNSNTRGTPFFMSPSKVKNIGKVAQRDDLYSIALSIAVLEAESYDDIYGEQIGVKRVTISNDCFLTELKMICRQILKNNVVRVLSGLKYGDYQSINQPKETINFTTLIANMILYDSFIFTHDDILKIMNQLILNEQSVSSMIKLPEQEKVVLMKNRENNRKAIWEVNNLKKHRQDEIKLRDQQQKDYLQQLDIHKNNPSETLKIINKQKETKLKQIENIAEANVKFKEKKLEVNLQYYKKAVEESIVYKQNGNLFQAIRPVVHEKEKFFYNLKRNESPPQIGRDNKYRDLKNDLNLNEKKTDLKEATKNLQLNLINPYYGHSPLPKFVNIPVFNKNAGHVNQDNYRRHNNQAFDNEHPYYKNLRAQSPVLNKQENVYQLGGHKRVVTKPDKVINGADGFIIKRNPSSEQIRMNYIDKPAQVVIKAPNYNIGYPNQDLNRLGRAIVLKNPPQQKKNILAVNLYDQLGKVQPNYGYRNFLV